jgi:hypothetical protein
VKYDHAIDDLIVNTLKANGPTHFNRLLEMTDINKRTLSAHLKKLCHPDYQTIVKDDKMGKGNEFYYSLQKNTEVELEYRIFEGVRTQREARDYENENSEALKNKKILLSLLLQAAGGSSWLKPISREPKPGDIVIPSPSSPTGYVTCYLESQLGVTPEDILEHRDFGNGGIFRHITFTRSLIDHLVNLLKRDGIYNLIRPITRTNNDNPEIGIEVLDERLERLIDYIACLISSVEENIRYSWIYRRKPSKLGSWDLKWYTSFFGRERTTTVLMEARQKRNSIQKEKGKKKHEMLNYGEKLLRLAGRSVVGIYHADIICDKYQYPLDDKKYLHIYEKYREFVREVINNGDDHNYSHLLRELIDLVYPKPLRRLHNTDPYLIRYVKNLPEKPLKQWTNIPVM